MTSVQILIVLLISLGAMCFAWWMQSRHTDALLRELAELRNDNRCLTEALVRSEGKPLVFRKPEPVPSQGWFDAKPKLVVSPKEK